MARYHPAKTELVVGMGLHSSVYHSSIGPDLITLQGKLRAENGTAILP